MFNILKSTALATISCAWASMQWKSMQRYSLNKTEGASFDLMRPLLLLAGEWAEIVEAGVSPLAGIL